MFTLKLKALNLTLESLFTVAMFRVAVEPSDEPLRTVARAKPKEHDLNGQSSIIGWIVLRPFLMTLSASRLGCLRL